MKKGIHPKLQDTIFVDISTKLKFYTASTLHSKEMLVDNGKEYAVHYRDVTSATHPVYTGEKRFVDTAGCVDKFFARAKARQRNG